VNLEDSEELKKGEENWEDAEEGNNTQEEEKEK